MEYTISKRDSILVLKLSGETLSGKKKFGIDVQSCSEIAEALFDLKNKGYEVGVVIGGGNVMRGIQLTGLGFDRIQADRMGMLATVFNGVALQQMLINIGCPAKVLTMLDCPKIAENYVPEKANASLNQGIVTIFVGGTGNPYFTTDTAAALRACETNSHMLMKATKVDGVYDSDPITHSEAKKFNTISHIEVLERKLGVIDSTADTLCNDNQIPIFVFNMKLLKEKKLIESLQDDEIGTLIKT